MRNPKLVPYGTIVRATSGEPEAVDEVLRHYGKLRRQEIEIYYSFVGKIELPD